MWSFLANMVEIIEFVWHPILKLCGLRKITNVDVSSPTNWLNCLLFSASPRCPPTTLLRALSGTLTPCSSPSSTRPETSTTPSSCRVSLTLLCSVANEMLTAAFLLWPFVCFVSFQTQLLPTSSHRTIWREWRGSTQKGAMVLKGEAKKRMYAPFRLELLAADIAQRRSSQGGWLLNSLQVVCGPHMASWD